MTPPLLGVGEEESHSNVTILTSSTSIEELGHIRSGFKERNYMGLSDCSSVDSSTVTAGSNESKTSLNLKATELSLGLPGSQSPDRDSELNMKKTTTQIDEKPLFPLHPSKDAHYSSSHKAFISGNKRVFSDAMDGFSEGINNSEVNAMLSPRPNSNATLKAGTIPENIGNHPGKVKETDSQKIIQERTYPVTETRPSYDISASNSDNAPAPKAQVVGWPPIRSFRKNSLATPSKNSNEVDGKAMAGALFVKVSMDGAPYLRKVDLRSYCAYKELSSALEKMFSCFTIGQYGSNGTLGREMLSESKLIDLLHGSEYVLTYEDKDGDWMLVGDVPWKMFIDSCKRMRIMKSSDAIGLAPRAVAKCRDRN